MNLLLASAPKPTVVTSSPSPYPICAGPLFHAPSGNASAVQAVPWLLPSSRYFQVASDGISNHELPPSALMVRATAAEVLESPALSVATAVSEYAAAGTFDQITVKFVARVAVEVCPMRAPP